jgi:hypothetical protein
MIKTDDKIKKVCKKSDLIILISQPFVKFLGYKDENTINSLRYSVVLFWRISLPMVSRT